MKYQSFIFKDYSFNPDSKILELTYSYDNELNFHEHFKFDFNFVDYDQKSLDMALNLLFLMAGVSYYKAYLAPEIKLEVGLVDANLAGFLSRTYQKGLGEFFYTNHIDPRTEIIFPVNSPPTETRQVVTDGGKLGGIGGGKDSLVAVEMLRGEANLKSFSVNHRQLLTPLVETIDLKHLWIEREIDSRIKEINQAGALNGHVPISAIIACVGLVAGILSGTRDVVVSNESSASEPSLIYDGVEINHQYSKSLEFEKDLQSILINMFGDSLRYYSILRPLSELRIAELFALNGFEKYSSEFSSCNRAFAKHGDHLYWCGECPKCAFVFMALTPFVERENLEKLWHKNLLLDPNLHETYEQLLGISGDKPLDCVGEIKESRSAMRMAQTIYPELSSYEFDLPYGYDYAKFSDHSMPIEEADKLKGYIRRTLP